MSPWVRGSNGKGMIKGPKQEKHHWWPGGLSTFWKGEDGLIGCIRMDKKSFRTQHRNLGALKDGHSFLYGEHRDASPWNQSEEATFDQADNNFRTIISSLVSMTETKVSEPLDEWRAVSDDKWLRNELAASLISLCLRSPRARFLASSQGRSLIGYERGSQVDRNVALGNILAGYRAYSRYMSGKGKVGIVRAVEGEFIYGDGFYHNIPAQGDIFPNPRMFVPLTPKLSVGYWVPSSYVTDPMFHVMDIGRETVNQLNGLVQVYSESELFYSNVEPELSQHFTIGKFAQVTDESNLALWLMNTLPGTNLR